MKRLMIGSLALGLLMPISSVTADQWERQKEQQQMMMERESGMHSDTGMAQRESRPVMGRESKLDPDSPRTIEDLEKMPATAAGREGHRGMDKQRQYPKRSGHRGEVEGGY